MPSAQHMKKRDAPSQMRTTILSRISKTRLLVYGVFLLLGIFVLIPQIGVLLNSFQVLQTISWLYTAAAIGLQLLTFFIAAMIYRALSFRRLTYGRTVIIQIAGVFANRLLPSGVGSIGINFLYLRKVGHNVAQAASVITINNVIGLMAHISVIGLLLIFDARSFSGLQTPLLPRKIIWIGLILLIAFLLAFYIADSYRHKIAIRLQQFLVQLGAFRHRKQPIALAYGASICLVLVNVASLLCAVRAVHGTISFEVALIVFTFGLVIGTITPTPGGLGGAEAGLVGALVAYGTPLSTAVASAVLYRLISYWFSLVLGGTAFIVAERRKYL
jgi:uncharacterized membrane protein YbhN (UPF0104 family)